MGSKAAQYKDRTRLAACSCSCSPQPLHNSHKQATTFDRERLHAGRRKHRTCSLLMICSMLLQLQSLASCTTLVLMPVSHKQQDLTRKQARRAHKKYSHTVVCSYPLHASISCSRSRKLRSAQFAHHRNQQMVRKTYRINIG